MVVRADYRAPNKKEFTIVSESGSGTVRKRVFKKLLEAEQESMREENQQRSAITPENYTFQLSDYKKTDTDEFYVLEAKPLTKNKFLFRGRIWVSAKDFAIARVEGQPAVNPSWWTLKTDFKRSYQKVSDFWLAQLVGGACFGIVVFLIHRHGLHHPVLSRHWGETTLVPSLATAELEASSI